MAREDQIAEAMAKAIAGSLGSHGAEIHASETADGKLRVEARGGGHIADGNVGRSRKAYEEYAFG